MIKDILTFIQTVDVKDWAILFIVLVLGLKIAGKTLKVLFVIALCILSAVLIVRYAGYDILLSLLH